MNSAGLLLVCLFSFGALALPRRLAALSLFGASLYITQSQQVELGLNFYALRFVEIAAFLRVLGRGDLRRIKFTGVDRWLLIFFSCLILFNAVRIGTLDLYQTGAAVDAWLVYFSFRALIGTAEEYVDFLKGSALLMAPLFVLMVIESTTGRNLFAGMGGVPEISIFRDGHYRSQASFRVAITAGSLGASFIPLYLSLFFHKPLRRWAGAGLVVSAGIMIASHSSGPLLATAVGVAGWFCWRMRKRMRLVRWGIVGILIALQLAMGRPVWFIFDRLSGILGGDGWHRSNLIDKFVDHTGQWWFSGMRFEDTSDWAATQLPWGGVDVTNYYVSIGIIGGLIPLCVFIKFLIECFRLVGRAAQAVRTGAPSASANEALVWGAGVTICAHAVNLTAVIYWDQSYLFWNLHLATAASLGVYALASSETPPHPIGSDPISVNRSSLPTARPGK